MKKIAFYFIIAALILNTSCHDDLEIESTTNFSESSTWGSETALELYTTGFYAALRDAAEIYSLNLSDGYSDILKYSFGTSVNSATTHNEILLKKDYVNISNLPLYTWDNYNRIRRQNEFLIAADKYIDKYGEDFLNIRKAEIRFIRAFSYFKMIRVYGGVIIRDETDGVDAENQKDKARATEEESWDFVIKDLQFAAQYLPDEWDDKWFGRTTKGAAYAMLCRCALYAKRWDVAIDAATEVEKLAKLGYYRLENNYADVFTSSTLPNNKELILCVDFVKPDFQHSFDTRFSPSGDGVVANKAYAVPTNELVDSYEMADGTEFKWNLNSAGQQMDESGNIINPYMNREPRFYASILYNGAEWRNRTIESFVGGEDGFISYAAGSNPFTTVTGYYIRKFLEESNTDFEVNGSDQYWIELRYAEVLLNLAEALAESDYNANSTRALQALNDIRGRVGLPFKTLTDAPDKDSFMKLLRQEKMKELAFEGHRYWDIRRWKIADKVIDGQQAHGVKIVKNSDGTFNYEIVNCDGGVNRTFPERYYLIPIPSSEIENNSLCKQNPLW